MLYLSNPCSWLQETGMIDTPFPGLNYGLHSELAFAAL